MSTGLFSKTHFWHRIGLLAEFAALTPEKWSHCRSSPLRCPPLKTDAPASFERRVTELFKNPDHNKVAIPQGGNWRRKMNSENPSSRFKPPTLHLWSRKWMISITCQPKGQTCCYNQYWKIISKLSKDLITTRSFLVIMGKDLLIMRSGPPWFGWEFRSCLQCHLWRNQK